MCVAQMTFRFILFISHPKLRELLSLPCNIFNAILILTPPPHYLLRKIIFLVNVQNNTTLAFLVVSIFQKISMS